jgi:transcriptional regulator with XRE-family HTH domain
MIPVPPSSGTVGSLVRRYRQLAGLTQEELGEKASLSVRAVRNLEQDKVRRPRRSTLQRLVSVLGASELDPAHLVLRAQVIELPVVIFATVDSSTVGWSEEWFRLQPLPAQVTEQFRPERVLVVQVLMACPACSAPLDAGARSAEWRSEWHGERRPPASEVGAEWLDPSVR